MLLRYILAISLLIGTNILSCSAEDSVTICDSSRGCFSAEYAETIYKRENNGHWVRTIRTSNGSDPYTFLSELIKRTVSDKDVTQLIQTLQDSRNQLTVNLSDLGITVESVRAHRGKLFEEVKESESDLLKSAPDKYNYLFDFSNIAKVVTESLRCPDDADAASESLPMGNFVSCKISDTNTGASVEASSCGTVGWLLPWRIKSGTNVWYTYSLRVPKAIKAFAEQDGPNANISYGLLDGSKYWQQKFWTDEIVDQLKDQINQAVAIDIVSSWQGYDRAAKEFQLLNAKIIAMGVPNIQEYGFTTGNKYEDKNPQPGTIDTLRIYLKVKKAAVINTVTWNNFLNNRHEPKSNWNDLLAEYQKDLQITQSYHWLADWKSCACHNTIELQIQAGQSIYKPAALTEAGKDAHLHGCSEIHLELKPNDFSWCDVYLCNTENVAIIIPGFDYPALPPIQAKHWLDKINTGADWHNKYILVQSNGKHDVRTIPGPIKW